MRLRVAFVGCLLAGCGSISDNGNNIDAAIVTDTTAPMVVSSTPANMETKAPVITPISVFFDEPLDEATVTAANVKVTYLPIVPLTPYFLQFDPFWTTTNMIVLLGEQPVRGTVSYDDAANHKLSFRPAAPLPYGVAVTVTFTGVKDAAGNAAAGAPIKFRTYANIEATRYSFNSVSSVPGSWQQFGPDMNGRVNKRGNRSNPGPDGIWHTQDDPFSFLFLMNVDAAGRVQDERQMIPGPDGLLGTADDTIGDFMKYTYDPAKGVTERYESNNPGTDMMYGTADDLPAIVQTYEYNAMGQLVGTTNFDQPGTDTVYRTADDKCGLQMEFPYDAMGRKTRDLQKNCGADGLPKTADDQIAQYKDYQYDENGLAVDIVTFTGRGPDNTFFTADDTGFGRYHFDRNAAGITTMITSFGGPGSDQRWRTADDIITGIEKDTLDEKGLLTMQEFMGPGPDNTYGTADDVVNSYIKFDYDGNGNRVESKNYVIGPDGMAHTADDRAYSVAVYSTSH